MSTTDNESEEEMFGALVMEKQGDQEDPEMLLLYLAANDENMHSACYVQSDESSDAVW